MQQYAVTAVFYINAENEDQAKHAVDNMVNENYLYLDKQESWDIVDTCELYTIKNKSKTWMNK
jgi:hypothetical protein